MRFLGECTTIRGMCQLLNDLQGPYAHLSREVASDIHCATYGILYSRDYIDEVDKEVILVRRNIPTAFFLLLAVSACHPLPTYTRSGDVKDIVISDTPTTVVVEVRVGEEIRWTNRQSEPVRIIFTDRISDQLLCRRNFCGYFTGGAEAFLNPDQSASLCFRDSGTVRYTVVIQSPRPGEHLARQGVIQVESAPNYPSVRQESTTP